MRYEVTLSLSLVDGVSKTTIREHVKEALERYHHYELKRGRGRVKVSEVKRAPRDEG